MMVLTCTALVVGLVVLPAMVYLGYLTLFSVPTRPPEATRQVRFAVVVPAHNEEDQIATTVQSLKQVSYPEALFRIVVVADNCSDATAQRAQAAGAQVLERTHDSLRGKGYALEYAFERILGEGWADAIVVVDADTLVSKSLLQAFTARLSNGALAVQAEYGVSNPYASWRTRLMAVALGMFHRLRSLGRERLGVSAGLRGNGMCFSCALLRQVPHKAYGLVEDVEYGIAIGRQGIRIVYADEAKVYGEMVSSAKGSQTQRQRWEGGRVQLVRQELLGLLSASVAQQSWLLFDLAMDLAVPPLSYLGVAVMLGVVMEAGAWAMGAPFGAHTWVWAINAACLFAYVARGAQLSGLGFKAVTALLWAPVYVAWKLILMLKPGGQNQAWIRTKRESENAPPRS